MPPTAPEPAGPPSLGAPRNAAAQLDVAQRVNDTARPLHLDKTATDAAHPGEPGTR